MNFAPEEKGEKGGDDIYMISITRHCKASALVVFGLAAKNDPPGCLLSIWDPSPAIQLLYCVIRSPWICWALAYSF